MRAKKGSLFKISLYKNTRNWICLPVLFDPCSKNDSKSVWEFQKEKKEKKN